MSMDATKRSRPISRKREVVEAEATTAYGSRQIVIPMNRETYDDIWSDSVKVRKLVEELAAVYPELFPAEIDSGFQLSGFLPASKKMEKIRFRQCRIDGIAYTLRPSFVMPYCCGSVEELEKPLRLLSHGVPCWLISEVFGHDEMYWHRHLQRLGRNSVVSTTIFNPKDLPEHLAADEHHCHWQGKKGYIATTAAQDCLLGVALTDEADQEHLQEAYGVFAQEARELSPQYAPQTVNTDGWFATSNAFQALFSTIVPILCFLHGFLKIRDRCRKEFELHTKVWDIYRATNIRMFDNRMKSFQKWFESRTWNAAVQEMVGKIWKRKSQYRLAYKHPDCYRTSNQVDRPMNRIARLLYAGRGLHGHQKSSELRLRGWALLHNFRPLAHRAGVEPIFTSYAHRINRKQYHQHWLHNLMISTSRNGQKSAHRIR
jgi:hypothetical protein